MDEADPPECRRISVGRLTNPSIWEDQVLLREVNYDLDWNVPEDWRPDTVNYLGRLVDRKVENLTHLEDNHRSNPVMENGLEDGRLIRFDGRLHGLFTAHYHSGGRMVVTRNTMTLVDLESMKYRCFPTGRTEKNWMPFIQDGHLRAIYSLSPLIILDLSERMERVIWEGPGLTEKWSGGSQLIPYQGGYLGVVHRHQNRIYEHAFVALDGHSVELSPPFRFRGERVEFCAGIAQHDQELCLSFGSMDTDGYLTWVGFDASMKAGKS